MLDTTSVTHVVTSTHTTIYRSIQGSLDAQHWMLLFFGWLIYWLKTMNSDRQQAAGQPFFTKFWGNNFLEIPISAISCLALAMMANGISTDLIDLHGTIAVFTVGYSSSSMLNALISSAKPTALKTAIP